MYVYSWEGVDQYTIYQFGDSGKELKTVKDFDYSNKSYYTYKNGKKVIMAKNVYSKAMKTYMPEKEKLVTPFDNTPKILSEYLK